MGESLISIGELLRNFKKRLWIIILITLMTTALGFWKTRGLVPSYTGAMKVLISTSDKEMDYYSVDQIDYYSNFNEIFLEVIRAGDYLKEPLENNGVETNYNQVKYAVSISPGTNVPIFTISYGCGNKDDVEKVITTIYDTLMDELKKVQPEVKSKIVEDVSVATINPDKKSSIVIGFAVGLIFSCAIVMILIYLDGNVKGIKQLEKLTKHPIIGVIPTHDKEFEKEERKNVHSR